MVYCWKTEYYCIADDEAIAWLDTLEEAQAYANTYSDIERIEKVRHYQDDHETIWERGE